MALSWWFGTGLSGRRRHTRAVLGLQGETTSSLCDHVDIAIVVAGSGYRGSSTSSIGARRHTAVRQLGCVRHMESELER